MIYQCIQCSHMIPVGRKDFELEIECGKCTFQTCGKCFTQSHYPALCHESERWSTLSSRPFQGTTFLYNRLVGYIFHWNLHNTLLHLLNAIQIAHEQFSQESHQRFQKRLILPFHEMREVVEFNRWFRLHAAFNPSVESVLGRESILFS